VVLWEKPLGSSKSCEKVKEGKGGTLDFVGVTGDSEKWGVGFLLTMALSPSEDS